MTSLVSRAVKLLSPSEKRRGLVLLCVVIVMAILETAGVASVMPFLGVLGNPGLIESNAMLAQAYAFSGAANTNDFLILLGIASFAFVLVSALFRVVANYAMNNYTEQRRHSIGKRLLATYLRQPYEYFLNQHSADLAKSILSEVDQLTQNIYRPLIQMVAYTVVLVTLVAFLVVVDYRIAFIVAIVIGGAYVMIFLAVRGVLNRIGRDRLAANKQRFTTATEALGGIKEIKLRGHEDSYLARFEGPSMRYARHQAANTTIAMVPKFLIEAIGFGGILLLALMLLIEQGGSQDGSLGRVLPILGIYAFAGYRMLPAAQNIYSSLANMRFGAAALDSIYADMQLGGGKLTAGGETDATVLVPEKEIRLASISYAYPGSERTAIDQVDIRIAVGSRIGLVGSTGSGKTTLADLLLGLLRPTSGAIEVDGVPVDDAKVRSWQRTLGYVPQTIFLTDASIAENIAFGVPAERIDQERVRICARMADVHDFVMNTMPAGFDTQVGERGVRLSGGQRQRIGIARALYLDPGVLVLDEATSALDNKTEQDVMNAVLSLDRKSTVVMIAHRLSTVRSCDCIYLLENGAVSAQGTYDQLLESSPAFRRMALLESHGGDPSGPQQESGT
jgi:ABC-type multidrug transport system fused ATPase/permease subunit